MATETTPSSLSDIEKSLEKEKKDPVIQKLSQHIDKIWKQNQQDFKPVRQRMIEQLRRVRGEYDSRKLVNIRAFKGTEIYIRNSENKARSAESWIKDIYRGDTDLPWTLEPTTLPDLPDDSMETIKQDVLQEALQVEEQMTANGLAIDKRKVAKIIQEYYEEKVEQAQKDLQKEARERTEKVAQEIRDDNEEGGWNSAFKQDFLWYFVRMPFGVIKGPVLTQKKEQVWVPTQDSYELQAKNVLAHDVYCVSPFNIFPSKDIKSLNDGDLIEVHDLTRESLYNLIGVPGYNETKIRAVLDEYDRGKLKGKWFTIDDEKQVKQAIEQAKKIETNPPTQSAVEDNIDNLIRAQEFYGTVRGKWLLEWGLKENLDPDRQYQANCWKIGNHVIKAVINPDSMGRKPYHASSWAKNPESWIGEGLVEFSGPLEDALNAVMRALINNIAIASGPMAELDKDRVDTSIPIYPWRQLISTSRQMREMGPAVNYYQPQMHAQELITAYTFLSRVLDEMTVPAYAQGQNQTGVTAGTATVFTELLAAASRSTKAVVSNIDDDIIEPYITMCYDLKQKFNPEFKADAKVVAKGVEGLLVKEQQAQRKVEYLQIAMTPILSQILGAKNLGAIAAQIAKSNNISLPDIKRLEDTSKIEEVVQQMLMSQSGIDPIQANGQMARGGGAPTSPQGLNPNGSKAGVVND